MSFQPLYRVFSLSIFSLQKSLPGPPRDHSLPAAAFPGSTHCIPILASCHPRSEAVLWFCGLEIAWNTAPAQPSGPLTLQAPPNSYSLDIYAPLQMLPSSAPPLPSSAAPLPSAASLPPCLAGDVPKKPPARSPSQCFQGTHRLPIALLICLHP